MLILKLQTQCPWNVAGVALGYPDQIGPSVAVGWVNRATREGTTEALRGAAEDVVQRLQDRPSPVDYRRRAGSFAGLVRINETAWSRVLKRAGMTDSSKRRYSSAIWLWSELTGGYPLDAPGFQDTPARASEMYHQFVAHTLPQLRLPLLAHGRELLAQAGDPHPERAELLLA